MMYEDIAGVYDKLTRDVDYAKLTDYIEKLFAKNGAKPLSVLDLGCGTGNICLEMCRRGYDMTGADISIEMLSAAADKARAESADILFLHQDIAEFELFGTVDAIICVMDVLNHMLSFERLMRVFKLVRNYLNYGGLFIFDLNTTHKLRNELGSGSYFDVQDDFAYIWNNKYFEKKNMCRFDLTYFLLDEKTGQYDRLDEILWEKAYSIDEVSAGLAAAGLKITGIYDDMKLRKPRENSKRIFFCAQKPAVSDQ